MSRTSKGESHILSDRFSTNLVAVIYVRLRDDEFFDSQRPTGLVTATASSKPSSKHRFRRCRIASRLIPSSTAHCERLSFTVAANLSYTDSFLGAPCVLPGAPKAVFRRKIPRQVAPHQGMLLTGPWTDVGDKSLVGVQPAFADGNPQCAVTVKAWIAATIAA